MSRITYDALETLNQWRDEVVGEIIEVLSYKLSNNQTSPEEDIDIANGIFDRLVGNRFLALPEETEPETEEKEDDVTRRTIKTLDELRALPVHSVVLEDQYEMAYQKVNGEEFTGDGGFCYDSQVDLPVTVIYEPEVK